MKICGFTSSGDFLDWLAGFFRHVPEHREDDKSSPETRHAVDATRCQRIPGSRTLYINIDQTAGKQAVWERELDNLASQSYRSLDRAISQLLFRSVSYSQNNNNFDI